MSTSTIPAPIWYLVTPTDAITFRAASCAVATFVTYALGRGQLMAYTIDESVPEEERNVPFFNLTETLDSFVVERGWAANQDEFTDSVVTDSYSELVAAFQSVIYGDLEDRKLVEMLLAALPEDQHDDRLRSWNDEKRLGIMDYAAHARQFLTALTEPILEEERRAS